MVINKVETFTFTNFGLNENHNSFIGFTKQVRYLAKTRRDENLRRGLLLLLSE